MKGYLLILLAALFSTYTFGQSRQIDSAMNAYDKFILQGAYDSIANMFTLDGILSGEGQQPMVGREPIRTLLRSFQGATVLQYTTTANATSLKKDTAIQSGSYIQIVKLPSGDTLELAGDYTATWLKEHNKLWKISKMYTHNYRNLKEEKWVASLPINSIAKIYGEEMMHEGISAASAKLHLLMQDTGKYYLNETEFNRVGYIFINRNKKEEAVEWFKNYTQLFPSSWNAFDSYGEALLKYDQKELAVKMYKRSVEINPNNENGKKILKGLMGGDTRMKD